jgi:anti-anti-sigma regulatory factor
MTMLRIGHDDTNSHRVVLVLQGHILLEGAELLESECEEVLRSGRSVVLDFTRVFFIGRTGFEALKRLSRVGVEIVRCPPLLADMLEHEGIAVGR